MIIIPDGPGHEKPVASKLVVGWGRHGTTHDPRGWVAEGDSMALAQAVQVAERECGNWVKS